MRWVSLVDLATGYGLDGRMIGVRITAEAGNFSVRHHVQTGSGADPASYPMGTGGSLPGDVKLTTHLHLVPRSKNVRFYISTPQIRLYGVVLS